MSSILTWSSAVLVLCNWRHYFRTAVPTFSSLHFVYTLLLSWYRLPPHLSWLTGLSAAYTMCLCLSNSMDQNPPWEPNSRLSCQEIPSVYWTLRLIIVFTRAATSPFPEPAESSHLFILLFLRSVLMLSSNLLLFFQEVSYLQASRPNFVFLISPMRATCPPISSSLIFGVYYKLRSSSLYSLLQPHATSSL
jgi:hypothetical protein